MIIKQSHLSEYNMLYTKLIAIIDTVKAEINEEDSEGSGQYNEPMCNKETFQNTTNYYSFTFWKDIERKAKTTFQDGN